MAAVIPQGTFDPLHTSPPGLQFSGIGQDNVGISQVTASGDNPRIEDNYTNHEEKQPATHHQQDVEHAKILEPSLGVDSRETKDPSTTESLPPGQGHGDAVPQEKLSQESTTFSHDVDNEPSPDVSEEVSSKGIQWHYFTGRDILEKDSVEFHRQVDHLEIWMDKWSHQEKCNILEKLLARSNLSQFNFLWTTVHPTLHRDFMYTAKLHYPHHKFPPISSHVGRITKARRAVRNYYHMNSAYLRNRVDVLKCNRVFSADDGKPLKDREKPEVSALSKSLPALRVSETQTCRSAPEARRHNKEPIRRHMFDYHDSHNEGSMYGAGVGRGYHPVLHDDLPRLTKSMSEVQLNRTRQSMSGTHPQSLPPITSLSSEAWQLMHWYSTCWNDVQRNEFLHKMVRRLDARQLYFLASSLSLKQSRDFLDLLPDHLAFKVLSYLEPSSLLIAAQVSKRWNQLAGHDVIWKEKCKHVELNVPISQNPNSWKKIYRDNVYLKSNWQEGACKIIDLRGHTAKVHCVTFDGDHRLASGGKDNTVRVWDVNTGALLQTFKGHSKGVWSVKFFTKHLLISGSFDGTLKVWNLRNGRCARTMLGHDGCIWNMALRNNLLASVSQDKTVRVWDLKLCSLMFTLTGHNQAVFCVDISEDCSLVISGSADRSVRLWSTVTGHQTKVIWVSQTTSVMALSYCNGYFACAVGEVVSLWRVDTSTCLRKYLEHEKRVETVGLRVDKLKDPDKPRGLLVTAGQEGLVKYWHINRKRSHHTLKASHGSPVNCIYFDKTKIVSACSDFRIRVWNFMSS